MEWDLHQCKCLGLFYDHQRLITLFSVISVKMQQISKTDSRAGRSILALSKNSLSRKSGDVQIDDITSGTHGFDFSTERVKLGFFSSLQYSHFSLNGHLYKTDTLCWSRPFFSQCTVA